MSSAMQRYIAFLDILGFKSFVKRTSLGDVKKRLHSAIASARFADCGGYVIIVEGNLRPNERMRFVRRFSFSDSFVLVTEDDSVASLNSIIAVTGLYARKLFGQQFPLRGAIVRGEADFVPDTNHIVGNGVLDAIELETQQEWFGVMLAPQLGTFAEVVSQLDPRITPLVIPYNVPMKCGAAPPAIAINWRLNLWSTLGVKWLFPTPADERQTAKRDNALRFAKHVRDSGLEFTPQDRPWLQDMLIQNRPVTESPFPHGDEY